MIFINNTFEGNLSVKVTLHDASFYWHKYTAPWIKRILFIGLKYLQFHDSYGENNSVVNTKGCYIHMIRVLLKINRDLPSGFRKIIKLRILVPELY